MDIPDFIFKLIIVGDSFTGKTSLLNKSCNNTFKDIINLFLIYINIKHVDRYKR